jgi:SNF2 family DNA or RNA helicase
MSTIDLTTGSGSGSNHEAEVSRRLNTARQRLNGRLIVPHQTDGLRWLIQRELSLIQGGILADEMGLGKTVQMISLILSDEGATNPTLIVCDKSLMKQWEQEIKSYAPMLKPMICSKAMMEQLGPYFINAMGGNSILIISYGQLNRNTSAKEVNWRRVILDEAHRIKNHRSAVHNNCMAIRADSRWALTGTPIQKNRQDLVNLLKWCRLYTSDAIAACTEDLQHSANQYVLRRTFEDLSQHNQRLALPPLHLKTHAVTLTTEEKQLYNNLIQYGQLALRARDNAIDGDERREINTFILKILLRLQQCVVSPEIISNEVRQEISEHENNKYFDPKDIPDDICSICHETLSRETVCRTDCHHYFCRQCLDQVLNWNSISKCPICRKMIGPVSVQYPKEPQETTTVTLPVSSKVKKLQEVFDDVGREKAIIFTHWRSEMEMIAQLCELRGIEYGTIHGQLSSEERDDVVRSIQEGSTQVIIVQIMCGACGLNITAATHVIFTSLDWTPSIHLQAIARAHRIGQTRNVTVHYLIATGTIDEHILSKQYAKLNEASIILDDHRIKEKMGDVVQNRSDMFNILKLLE